MIWLKMQSEQASYYMRVEHNKQPLRVSSSKLQNIFPEKTCPNLSGDPCYPGSARSGAHRQLDRNLEQQPLPLWTVGEPGP